MKVQYFALGFLPGLIVAMTLVLTAAPSARPIAYQKTKLAAPKSALVLLPGGFGNRVQDPSYVPPPNNPPPNPPEVNIYQPNFVWVYYGRIPGPDEAKLTMSPDDDSEYRYNLACYKIQPTARPSVGKITLIAIRDTSYDQRQSYLDPGTQKSVEESWRTMEDIFKKLRRELD